MESTARTRQTSNPVLVGSPVSVYKRNTKSVACNICHSRKVKCSGGTPCSNCSQAGKGDACKYPSRDRRVKLNESYVEELLKENEVLRANISSTTTLQEPNVLEPAQSGVAQDAAQNPLFGERPWFLPVASLDMPIHIDLAADAAFSTRFRQTLAGESTKHIPRMNFVSDDVILGLSEAECPWPSPARSRFLVKVALATVCRNYHMVRRSEVLNLLETALQNQGNSDRLSESKLFALFALGELYEMKVAPPDASFPGLLFFSRARKMVTVPAERPQSDTLEITLLLSLYSYALNRRHSAHLFADSAVRLGIVMGMHLNIPESLLSDRAAREHRVRIWWTAYIFDRIWASKLGHPVSVHDDDIDVDLPRNDGLDGHEDFGDHEYMLRNIELARLTGRIIPLIYGRRRQQKPFSQRVQQALSDLTSWVGSLPDHLQLHRSEDGTASPNNVIYLHLTFNQCVIMVTRPILLHVFRTNNEAKANSGGKTPAPIAEGAQKIAQTCIQCARHSFRLLSEAWVKGAFALFDYFYTQYLFSAANILVISALLEFGNDSNDADDFDTSTKILSQLAQTGNFGAKEFCLHIVAMKVTMEESSSNVRGSLRIGSTAPTLTGPNQQAVFPYMSPAMTTGMALTDSSRQQFLTQPDHNFHLADMTGLDEIQTPFWPDLWVGNWMNP